MSGEQHVTERLITYLPPTFRRSMLESTVYNLRINKQENSQKANRFVQPCGAMFA
jgi:hypothetical protein